LPLKTRWQQLLAQEDVLAVPAIFGCMMTLLTHAVLSNAVAVVARAAVVLWCLRSSA
jgi:hypothetical protein